MFAFVNPCAFGQPTPKITKKGRLMNITNLSWISWIGLMNLSVPEGSRSQWPICSWDVHPFPSAQPCRLRIWRRVWATWLGHLRIPRKQWFFGGKSTIPRNGGFSHRMLRRHWNVGKPTGWVVANTFTSFTSNCHGGEVILCRPSKSDHEFRSMFLLKTQKKPASYVRFPGEHLDDGTTDSRLPCHMLLNIPLGVQKRLIRQEVNSTDHPMCSIPTLTSQQCSINSKHLQTSPAHLPMVNWYYSREPWQPQDLRVLDS